MERQLLLISKNWYTKEGAFVYIQNKLIEITIAKTDILHIWSYMQREQNTCVSMLSSMSPCASTNTAISRNICQDKGIKVQTRYLSL